MRPNCPAHELRETRWIRILNQTNEPLPAPEAPKPHPVDVALAALSEHAAALLVSDRSSRFGELHTVMTVAQLVQRLRPPGGVADLGLDAGDADGEGIGGINPIGNPVMMRRHRGYFNDAADVNTQIIMLAQKFLDSYLEAEAAKHAKGPPDSRLNQVIELSDLMALRATLARDGEAVPDEITTRIGHLLKQIGEPPRNQPPP